MKVINYEPVYFTGLVDFLKENWSTEHPIYDAKLFQWQYMEHGETRSKIVLDKNNKIIGFLGSIPARYRYQNKISEGVSLSIWIIDKKLQGYGLGVLLLKEIEKEVDCLTVLGASDEAVSVYQKMGYSVETNYTRYVAPLGDFETLKSISNISELNNVVFPSFKKSVNHLNPISDFNVNELEDVSLESTKNLFSITKDSFFWNWRYIKNYGYKYLIFGGVDSGGIIVARIGRIISPDNPKLTGTKVLRLIEILPLDSKVWDGEIDDLFANTLKKVLSFAYTQGCVAVDFYCSNQRLDKFMSYCSFYKQNSVNSFTLAEQFQPFRKVRYPRFNYVWKYKHGSESIDISSMNTYFVKSDCDFDRPYIWPLPRSWR